MIRRFFSIVIFTCTVLTASFGQELVNRDTIASWAEHLRKSAPERGRLALKQTDLMLAQLSPQAGSLATTSCTKDQPRG